MINLLPVDEKKRIAKLYIIRLVSAVFVLMTLAVFAGYILMIPSYFLTDTKEGLVEQERELLESSQEYIEFDSLRDTVRIVNERLETMKRDSEPFVYSQLITKLLLLKTENVTISSIAYAKQAEYMQVDLRGQARDRADLVEFIQVLESDKDVDVTSAPVSNYVASDDLSYILQVNISLLEASEEDDEGEN